MEILIKAIVTNNPNLCRGKCLQTAAWDEVCDEFNWASRQHELPQCPPRGIKSKWRQMVAARKQRVRVNTQASGIRELTDEYEELLDEYIETESLVSSSGRSSSNTNTAADDCEQMAQDAARGSETPVPCPSSRASQQPSQLTTPTPASRSMTSLRHRHSSQSFSQAGSDSEGNGSFSSALSWKQARHTAASAIAKFAEATERFRESEREYRMQHLQVVRMQAEASIELSKSQVQQNSRVSTELHDKIGNLEEYQERFEGRIRENQKCLEDMFATLLSRLPGPSMLTREPASMQPTLTTISQESLPVSQQYRSTSIVSDASTPPHWQRGTCQCSQPPCFPN